MRVRSTVFRVPLWLIYLHLSSSTAIKRVVITTSTAAVVRPTESPLIFNESDWNEDSIIEVEEKGAAAPGYIKYFASKTLAEKGSILFHSNMWIRYWYHRIAAFEFYKQNKESLAWDLVTIAPPYVSVFNSWCIWDVIYPFQQVFGVSSSRITFLVRRFDLPRPWCSTAGDQRSWVTIIRERIYCRVVWNYI